MDGADPDGRIVVPVHYATPSMGVAAVIAAALGVIVGGGLWLWLGSLQAPASAGLALAFVAFVTLSLPRGIGPTEVGAEPGALLWFANGELIWRTDAREIAGIVELDESRLRGWLRVVFGALKQNWAVSDVRENYLAYLWDGTSRTWTAQRALFELAGFKELLGPRETTFRVGAGDPYLRRLARGAPVVVPCAALLSIGIWAGFPLRGFLTGGLAGLLVSWLGGGLAVGTVAVADRHLDIPTRDGLRRVPLAAIESVERSGRQVLIKTSTESFRIYPKQPDRFIAALTEAQSRHPHQPTAKSH